MTRGEITVLEVFIGEFRDYRQSDEAWKKDIDTRIRKVESFVTQERTKDESVRKQGLTRRAQVGILISAVGVVASIVFNVAAFITR